MTTVPTSPYIGRCTVKGCKHVKRVDVARSGSKSDRFGNVRPVTTTADYLAASAATCCPDHGYKHVSLRPIVGTVTDHECDARCTSAKGPICECSCGGANHGADH